MNIIELITKLFGNKAQKDMREIQPYVDQVKAVYPEIDALSNDELRARSQALMDKIAATVAPKKSKIAELRASIEELEIDKREKVYQQIDDIEKEIKEQYKVVLMEVLPEAFAIVKSTARRFAESEAITVTASQRDRDMAADARYDFIEIDGQQTIYPFILALE